MTWEKREKDGCIWYTLPEWEAMGARIVMTTRVGGKGETPYQSLNLALHVGDDSATVIENRKHFLKAVGWQEKDFVSVRQVHGKEIVYADKTQCGSGFLAYEDCIADADGIFTDEKGPVMATFYADCLPLAIFHPQKRLLGLAHAGWRGTFQNIGLSLIDAMRTKADFDSAELYAAVGAGIGACCYEVDSEFKERFCKEYTEAEDWFTAGERGKYYFDNVKANITLLQQAGIKAGRISNLGLCTACENHQFFSFRKEQGKTGRHGLWGALI